jgi:hypothetical protein
VIPLIPRSEVLATPLAARGALTFRTHPAAVQEANDADPARAPIPVLDKLRRVRVRGLELRPESRYASRIAVLARAAWHDVVEGHETAGAHERRIVGEVLLDPPRRCGRRR